MKPLVEDILNNVADIDLSKLDQVSKDWKEKGLSVLEMTFILTHMKKISILEAKQILADSALWKKDLENMEDFTEYVLKIWKNEPDNNK